MVATDTHSILDELLKSAFPTRSVLLLCDAKTDLLETVFSVRSVPKLYNEGQLPLESASRR
jgi:hypothetical protein